MAGADALEKVRMFLSSVLNRILAASALASLLAFYFEGDAIMDVEGRDTPKFWSGRYPRMRGVRAAASPHAILARFPPFL
jgi:hypothetical protein